MPIRKRIPATCASSGQSKRFLAALVLAHAPVQKNCMTLHDAEARQNLHFLSSPATLGESQKSLVFPRILPMKMGLWLGPESNRRHVDFQSTALPTELPSLRKFAIPRANHGDRSLKQKTPNAQRSTPNAFASRHPTPNSPNRPVRLRSIVPT